MGPKKFPKKMGLENPSYQEEEAEEAFEMEVSALKDSLVDRQSS